MKLLSSISALLIATALIGCNSSSTKENSTPENAPMNIQPVSSDTATKQPTTGTTTPPSVTPKTITPVVGKVGINPAHGQPGHRCDIAVGAPLDSKPTQTTINNNQQPIINKNSQAVTLPSNNQQVIEQKKPVEINPGNNKINSAGLNPAHGQPGHRCDIAVGAPLDSKPTITQPVNNINTQPIIK